MQTGAIGLLATDISCLDNMLNTPTVFGYKERRRKLASAEPTTLRRLAFDYCHFCLQVVTHISVPCSSTCPTFTISCGSDVPDIRQDKHLVWDVPPTLAFLAICLAAI